MRHFWFFVVIALTASSKKSNAEFPPSIPKCGFSEITCIENSIQYVLSNYAKSGLKELNLIPFDPLHIKSMKLGRNPKSSVNIELEFKNASLLGLGESKVTRAAGFVKNFTGYDVVELITPKLVLKGTYAMNGNVLILPVVGEGDSVTTLENTAIVMKAKKKAIEKNGKTYVGFEYMKLMLKPKRVHFRFENLFNGNKELGAGINEFLNENWSEVFGEIQPAVSEAVALIINQLVTYFFSKYPYEEYFNSA